MKRKLSIFLSIAAMFTCLAFIPWLLWQIYQHGPWIGWWDSLAVYTMALAGAVGFAHAAWEDLKDELDRGQ